MWIRLRQNVHMRFSCWASSRANIESPAKYYPAPITWGIQCSVVGLTLLVTVCRHVNNNVSQYFCSRWPSLNKTLIIIHLPKNETKTRPASYWSGPGTSNSWSVALKSEPASLMSKPVTSKLRSGTLKSEPASLNSKRASSKSRPGSSLLRLGTA